jgi:hypothetical protein
MISTPLAGNISDVGVAVNQDRVNAVPADVIAHTRSNTPALRERVLESTAEHAGERVVDRGADSGVIYRTSSIV